MQQTRTPTKKTTHRQTPHNPSPRRRRSRTVQKRQYKQKPPVPLTMPLPTYSEQEDRYILPPEYWAEEQKFILKCLGGRLSRQSEKRWADFYAAVDVLFEVGDAALPEFLRQGGWDDGVFSASLNQKVKKTDPLAFSIAEGLAGL